VVALVALLPAQEWAGRALGLFSVATNRAILWCGRLTPGPFAVPLPNPWLYYAALVLAWKYRRHPPALALAAALVILSFLWRW
jgi:hypothetical protein